MERFGWILVWSFVLAVFMAGDRRIVIIEEMWRKPGCCTAIVIKQRVEPAVDTEPPGVEDPERPDPGWVRE